MADDEAVVICMPTAGHAPNVPGSSRAYCIVCAEEVWMSPSSRQVAAVVTTVCIDCAPGMMEATGGEFAPLTPAALREVGEWLDELRRQR